MRQEKESRWERPEGAGAKQEPGYPETAGSLLAERILHDDEEPSEDEI